MKYDFNKMLEYSISTRSESDAKTIEEMIPNCAAVVQNDSEGDDSGIDYIAKLDTGITINVDAKTRTPGCSKYWNGEPDLAIEIWSVMPGGKYDMPDSKKKPGWTFDRSKLTDMILYTFDPSDTTNVYLLPFHLLRKSAQENFHAWIRKYKVDIQDSGSWQSKAVFVPVSSVMEGLKNSMQGQA